MKGIILAGGFGNRLKPLTTVMNKHLLPVYNKPMVFFPLRTLLQAGIEDILVITGPEHAGGFMNLLGCGAEFGCNIMYKTQDTPGGIAQALGLAERFVGGDDCTVILGDNIFEDNFGEKIKSFKKGGMIFLTEVEDAERFGVATLDENNNVIEIEEKPEVPKSNLAVTGLYVYDNQVFDVVKTLKPSGRGELEITDVSNWYVNKKIMQAERLQGNWTDAGTFESLYRANVLARRIEMGKGRGQGVVKEVETKLNVQKEVQV